MEHYILGLPRACVRVKGFGDTAPANIFREDDLFIRCGKAVFFPTPFQNGDRRIVAVETLLLVDLLDLVRSKVEGMPVCHRDFGVNIKSLHSAFLRAFPSGCKGCFYLCQFFFGEVNKVVKGKCLQSLFGQFLKRSILFTADDFSICKGFNAKIHKIDSCLYFVLIVLSRGVGNTHICKVGVIRTVLLLVFLTAEIINEPFCLIQCIVRQVRAVNDLKALGRWIKLCNKVVGDGTAVPVLIQNNAHRDTIVVFLLDVLLKAIRACVLDAFTDFPVRAEIVDSADRLGLDGCFLCGRNHGAGNALAILNSIDRHIIATVSQHCKVGF